MADGRDGRAATGPVGWLRVVLRGGCWALLTYGCLVLLLLVRLVERPLCGHEPAGDALHHPVRLPLGAA